jgi:hypothetical protein
MPVGQKFKSSGMNWSDQTRRGQDFTRLAFKHTMELSGQKLPGNNAPRLWSERRVQRLRDSEEHPFYNSGSGSKPRKFASAMIAKIPLPLSRYIATTYHPRAA